MKEAELLFAFQGFRLTYNLRFLRDHQRIAEVHVFQASGAYVGGYQYAYRNQRVTSNRDKRVLGAAVRKACVDLKQGQRIPLPPERIDLIGSAFYYFVSNTDGHELSDEIIPLSGTAPSAGSAPHDASRPHDATH